MAAPMMVLTNKKTNCVRVIALVVLLFASIPQGRAENEQDDTTGAETAETVNAVKLESVFDNLVVKKQDDADQLDTDSSESESRLFSITSVLKSLLSPVIEEFKVGVSEEPEPEVKEEEVKAEVEVIEEEEAEAVVADVTVNETETVAAINETVTVNATATNETDASKKFKFQCMGRNITEETKLEVRLVNSSTLLEVLSFDKNRTSGDCVLVMFYAPWCQFCARTAPHYNALARAYPQLEVLAVDAVHFSNLNARFGTVAVPNVMLFHQSRSAIRFNHTERVFTSFIQFIKNVTGLEPNATVNVTDVDYIGPLSNVPTQDPDYLLWLAWVFVISCVSYMVVNSRKGQQAINRVRVLWQEHQHID